VNRPQNKNLKRGGPGRELGVRNKTTREARELAWHWGGSSLVRGSPILPPTRGKQAGGETKPRDIIPVVLDKPGGGESDAE